jgi:hypothetical protein
MSSKKFMLNTDLAISFCAKTFVPPKYIFRLVTQTSLNMTLGFFANFKNTKLCCSRLNINVFRSRLRPFLLVFSQFIVNLKLFQNSIIFFKINIVTNKG